jgi:FKBP-type peptidyl-prolyl cis-trans isomerase
MVSKIFILFLILVLSPPAFCGDATLLKTPKEKLSYGLGVDMARNIQRLDIEVDMEFLVKALNDVLSGGKLLLSEEELRTTVNTFQTEIRQKQVQAARIAGLDNKKEGDAFLTENKKRDGVVTLPNGLQYRVLRSGDGGIPTDTDTVEVHYRGTLINGTEFDSSYGRGKPTTFKVSGVITGWREALKRMPVGSKWQLFIPPELAYGPRGSGRNIGPNATLIFEIELLGIN